MRKSYWPLMILTFRPRHLYHTVRDTHTDPLTNIPVSSAEENEGVMQLGRTEVLLRLED